jgi:hypothetical protein
MGFWIRYVLFVCALHLILNKLIFTFITSQLVLLRDRLERLRKCIAEKHPDKVDLVSSPDSIDIDKLGGGGVVMTDTCNTAQKLRRILVEASDDILDLDCVCDHSMVVYYHV